MILNPFGFNNPQNSIPATGGFNNHYTQLRSSLNVQNLMQGMQNNVAGVLPQRGQLITNPPILPQFFPQQLGFLGGLPNPSLFSLQQVGFPWRPNMSQSLNQMMGFLSNGPLGSQNTSFAPISHPLMAFSGNHNRGFVGSVFPQSAPPGTSNSTATDGFETEANCLSSQPVSSNSMQSNASNNIKESVHSRLQIPKTSVSPVKKCQSERELLLVYPTTRLEDVRSLTVLYNESEIQAWREARKRNFPTRDNIEKRQKLGSCITNDEYINSDAKLRRQQLKEVLTKQAELGIEVAEIPSSYLTEPEMQALMTTNEKKGSNMDSRIPNKRTNNKRRRYGRDNRRVKKPKIRDETLSSPPVKKREPTLLRKLLNNDIRRDKSHLLQAFRFMVLNSFFKDRPEKPLVFPLIKAKDDICEPRITKEKEISQEKVDSDHSSIRMEGKVEETKVQELPNVVLVAENECDAESSDSECVEVVNELCMENGGIGDKSEEGEITD
ncbi:hypothetical protein AXF42_Ash013744 [Apostasia shenzhenica]|uniref:FMR1-interacting protein 1 conserved domain-containing protein n=1 Tax=Apostasia shenzhenica TaxID=1088818 RepID=A0A2I0A4Q1_9ASPA|nr:hypothetical protein AXF42_Ash013744 [Apostasia shenzhenica]